jgi:phenylalanyl-tRNA synthetase beta chain
VASAVHPYRTSAVVSTGGSGPGTGESVELGVVGELDPAVVARFGLFGSDGRPRRVGWLDLDLGVVLDTGRVPRRPEESRPLSRFPSSDIDLALMVSDAYPADLIGQALQRAAGDLAESVTLFDVYRGTGVTEGARSLAYRLRFCATDHTLTDDEVGQLRAACIAAVEKEYGAVLR